MKWWQKRKEWEFAANRAYLPFSLSVTCFDNSKRYTDKVLPLQVADRYGSYRDNHYLGKRDKAVFIETQIKKGPTFLFDMACRCVEMGSTLLQSSIPLYKTDFSLQSHVDIADALGNITEAYKSFSVFLIYVWSLDDSFSNTLNNLVGKYVSETLEQVEWKKSLTEPIKFNEGQYEQLSLLKVISTVKDRRELTDGNKILQKEIGKHLQKYAWLPVRWLKGKPATPKDILDRLQHLFDEGEITEKIEYLEDKPREVKKSAEEFIKKFNVEKKDAEMIWLVKEYVYLRTYRTDTINQVLYRLIPLLEMAAKRLSIMYEDILYLSPEEISEGLRYGKLRGDIQVAERKYSWALMREKDSLVILGGKEADECARIQGFNESALDSVKELKGQVGYKGDVRGVVKVVLSPEDIGKVQKGDILVSVMTYPSYIAAMEKASAFVTDEGGILCHAAIVAREMKKPCIISTKTATRVLKDGDLVEVDAERGVVSILKRSKE